MIGDHDAVEGIVDDRLEQRMAPAAAGKLHDAGGHGEQRDNARRAEQCQQRQNVGSGVSGLDVEQACGGAKQRHGDQQHQADRA